MPNVFAVYVAATEGGQTNLEAGLNHLVWGWRDSVLARKDNRATAQQIKAGDLLVMGTHGPNPRVAAGGWAQARLGRALLLRFTSGLYQGKTRVWPDEVDRIIYPNRADFEVVYDVRAPEVASLDPVLLEALRWSANTQGSPVQVALPSDRAPRFEVEETGAAGTDEIDHHGDFDTLAEVLVRREQRKIRKLKFGSRPTITCDVCAKTYPARLVRAAHIKRRSRCTPDELRDLHNVMAACALGCDEMFEHGYIGFDDSGRVVAVREADGDLAAAVHSLLGRNFGGVLVKASPYLAWHRLDHGRPRDNGASDRA